MLVAAASAPASAVASAPAARQRVLASTCDPSSGTRTFYSWDEYSKGNARLCVTVLQRGDGTATMQANFSSDFFYYWGAAWYSDGTCIFGCFLNGHFTLYKDNAELHTQYFGEPLRGNSGYASHSFDVGSGHYRLDANLHKEGGYWRNEGHTASSAVPIHMKLEVDVP
jgi:hypothetical protein